MIEIESDEPRNLFHIRYHGHVTAEETARWVEPMEQALAKMRPGFGVLVDFTNLESMEVECAPHIRQIMDYCNAHGVAAVVRVIPDPQRDIGMQIMSRFHYGEDVQIVTVSTVEEAMKNLFE